MIILAVHTYYKLHIVTATMSSTYIILTDLSMQDLTTIPVKPQHVQHSTVNEGVLHSEAHTSVDEDTVDEDWENRFTVEIHPHGDRSEIGEGKCLSLTTNCKLIQLLAFSKS